jgi:hypothetical protein
MPQGRLFVAILASMILAGCATIPTGPSVMVLPTPGKPLEQFQGEDAVCRQWAAESLGPGTTPEMQSAVTSAAVGTAVGAAVGAVFGSVGGHAGSGAAIGAASGLAGGTLMGLGAMQAHWWEVQRRYDIAYQQCMYTKGNQVPGVAQNPPAPRRNYPPPPPPPPNPPPDLGPAPAPGYTLPPPGP